MLKRLFTVISISIFVVGCQSAPPREVAAPTPVAPVAPEAGALVVSPPKAGKTVLLVKAGGEEAVAIPGANEYHSKYE